MSAETLIDSIISSAQALAGTTVSKAIGYTDDAQTAAVTVTDLGAIPVPVRPNPPAVVLPPSPDVAEDRFRTTFAELFNQLGPDFDAKLDAYVTRFFPQIDGCLQSSVDTWLCNTINNGATGIPIDVENQIWERSRARELRDFARKDDELVTMWAERGFALPPGALYAAEQELQRDLTEKISTHSRDVAIKQVDVQIATIKFAVEQGIRLRISAAEASARYLSAWLDVSKISVEYANGILHARTAYYSALAAYYGALIQGERLIYDWGHDNAVLTVEQERHFVALVNSNTDARVRAAITAAQTVGSIGAAALAAQNSMAHISNDTIVAG
jgi:hypothetical protein